MDLGLRLLLTEEKPGPILEMIEAEALRLLQDKSPTALVDLAYDIFQSDCPALGILVARSVVPLTHYFEACVIFEGILEARDQLGLPPYDPYQDILDNLSPIGWNNDNEDSVSLVESQHELEFKNQEVRKLKNQLTEINSQLARREKQLRQNKASSPLAPVLEKPTPDDDLADMKTRIDSLKEELKNRHDERNHMRQELRQAQQDIDKLKSLKPQNQKEPSKAEEDAEDNLLLAEDNLSTQPFRIPKFPKNFREILKDLPSSTARSSLSLIGRLAAGEPSAFRGIKRLRMIPDVSRQRVGLHYRLLIRLKPEIIEVLKIINRKDLEKTIKRWN